MVLGFDQVVKEYPTTPPVRALDRVSFTVERNELLRAAMDIGDDAICFYKPGLRQVLDGIRRRFEALKRDEVRLCFDQMVDIPAID